MEQLHSAVRLYESIVPRSALREYGGTGFLPDRLSRSIRDWIWNYVLPGIEPLIGNGGFRLYARWPFTFCDGETSEQRRLVEAVDLALVNAAQVLELFKRKRSLVTRLELSRNQLEHFSMLKARCSRILDRPGNNLVSPLDFFEPWADQSRFAESYREERIEVPDTPLLQTGQILIESEQAGAVEALPATGRKLQTIPTLGNWLPAFNPELQQLGSVMLGCMLHRVELYRKDLRSLRNLYRRNHNEFPRLAQGFSEEATAWRQLEDAVTALRCSAAGSDFAQTSGAACAAVQLRNALGSCDGLEWLKLPSNLQIQGASSLRSLIHNRLTLTVAERIANAVNRLARRFSTDQVDFEEARASGGLILLKATRQVWWHTVEVTPQEEFTELSWKLLRLLAEPVSYTHLTLPTKA